MDNLGFPIADVASSGEMIITKVGNNQQGEHRAMIRGGRMIFFAFMYISFAKNGKI